MKIMAPPSALAFRFAEAKSQESRALPKYKSRTKIKVSTKEWRGERVAKA